MKENKHFEFLADSVQAYTVRKEINNMPVKLSEEARKRKGKYDAERTAKVGLQLNLKFQVATDSDLVDFIKSQPNKVDYIRHLVRADMARRAQEDAMDEEMPE